MNLKQRLAMYEEMTDEQIANMTDEEYLLMEEDLEQAESSSSDRSSTQADDTEDDEIISESGNETEDENPSDDTSKLSNTRGTSSNKTPSTQSSSSSLSSTSSAQIQTNTSDTTQNNKVQSKEPTVKLVKDNVVSQPVSDKTSKFILKTIDVPLISYVNITENRTLYSDAVIQTGLNHPITKAAIEGKKFFSELDHPNVEIEDRIRTRLNSPIVGNITKVWRNEKDGHYWGTLDIYDNDSGNLVVNLLDYGSELGISIRAEGNHVDKVDTHGYPYKEIVADDEFIIWGFDIVIFPSSRDAKIPLGKSELLESVMDNRGVSFLSTTKEGLSFKRRLFEGFTSAKFSNSSNDFMSNTGVMVSNPSPIMMKTPTISYRSQDDLLGAEDPRLLEETAKLYATFGEPDSSVSTIKNNGIEMVSNKDNISLRQSDNPPNSQQQVNINIDDLRNLDNYGYQGLANEDEEKKEVIMEEYHTDNINESHSNTDTRGLEKLVTTLDKLLDILGITCEDYYDLDDLNDLLDELMNDDDTDDQGFYALSDDDIERELDTELSYEDDITYHDRRGSQRVSSRSKSHKSKLMESANIRPNKSNVVRQYKVVQSTNPFIKKNISTSGSVLSDMGFKIGEF